MIKFSVATNWDFELIERIKDYNVEDLFGQISNDPIGGGRSKYILPEKSMEYAEAYIKEVHKHGMKFNYLANSICLNNKEFTREFYKTLEKHFQWICDIGVDLVTLANPYLIRFVKSEFPSLKIVSSTFCRVDSVQKAKFYEDMGADVILMEFHTNRDFELLSTVCKAVSAEIELHTNNFCLYKCPYTLYHANLLAHSSSSHASNDGFVMDYCLWSCTAKKNSEPVEIIKSRWIRPDDIGIYENIGISRFKLADRSKTTDWLVNTVKAYSERHYSGNLADVLNVFGDSVQQVHPKYFIRPELVNVERLVDEIKLPTVKPYIDNRKLDGFLEGYRNRNCALLDCNECGYCQEIADLAVTLDQDKAKEAKAKTLNLLDDLITGTIYG